MGLMREGSPGHKGILHHQGQTLPSPSLQGSHSAPFSQRYPPSPLYRSGGWLEEQSPVSSLSRHFCLLPELVGNFSAAAFAGELRRGVAEGSWQGWGGGQLPAGKEWGVLAFTCCTPWEPPATRPCRVFQEQPVELGGTQILPCPLNHVKSP